MCEKMSAVLSENMNYLNDQLKVNQNFDVVYRVIRIGGREACMYFIDGFCKDELMQKMLQYFMDMKEEDLPENAHEMSKKKIPYVEVDLNSEWKEIIYFILSGVFALFIDGYEECLLIDSRSYPARSVSEPEKDKTLRGSKDGFVETVVFNTALIRRRIRSTDLRMEIMKAGNSSQTDIVLCYMNDRVDHDFLNDIKNKISHIHADALTMNQESLAEVLMPRNWWNPYPKFKYTERPDTAAACILEGSITVLVDNSPSAMIIPTSLFDIIEDPNDYYFPPVTGTYLRMTRILTSIMALFVTPVYLLLLRYPDYVPDWLGFVMIQDEMNVPPLLQLLLLELAIDGLRMAAVNTPSMLTTPLSVVAGIVFGDYTVNSGWFNSEIMLYMAFVAVANYTQNNMELGYAIKFQRIILLVLTGVFGIWGFITGILLMIVAFFTNRTMAGRGYLYPLIPWDGHQLFKRVFRISLPRNEKVSAQGRNR